MVFTGIYEHTIDTKSRLAIPSDIRRQLLAQDEGGGGTGVCLYVTLDEGRQALCLWPRERFEQRARQLDESPRSSQELLPYERLFFSMAGRAELDKQGRIRIPDNLLKMIQLDAGSEVSVIGVNDHMEVWDRAGWQHYVTQTMAQNPHILMHPRQVMREESLIPPGSETSRR